MVSAPLPTTLPPEFHRYFWDVDATKVNPAQKPHYVINRLLDKGGVEAARWVLNHYPQETIVDTLKTVRDFSPRNGTFWAYYLGIPHEEVACLQPSYRKMRKQLWPH